MLTGEYPGIAVEEFTEYEAHVLVSLDLGLVFLRRWFVRSKKRVSYKVGVFVVNNRE